MDPDYKYAIERFLSAPTVDIQKYPTVQRDRLINMRRLQRDLAYLLDLTNRQLEIEDDTRQQD